MDIAFAVGAPGCSCGRLELVPDIGTYTWNVRCAGYLLLRKKFPTSAPEGVRTKIQRRMSLSRWFELHCLDIKKKKLILIYNCHRFLSEQVLRNEWFIRSTWLYRLKKLKHNLNRSLIYLRNANSSAPITTNKLSRAANESSKLNQENCVKRGKTSLTRSRLLLILIWLFEEVARIFRTNHKAKKWKTEAITDKFRLSIL